jgi:phosphoribosylformylglycinamidine cyclo-ligase
MTYADAGVDIDRKDAFTQSLDAILRRTFTERVIPNPGGFAGLFRLDYRARLFRRNYREPVLVACCDGVGTKIKLAAQMGIFDTIGIDLVAMNVNDLIVQGAEPLFFLDYIATPILDEPFLKAVVRGIGEGCRRAGCALLGGETAHMPDLYAPGDFDLAGFCVGVVELRRVQKPSRVRAGDVVLGLASDGIHSNGYTLVRRIVRDAALDLGAVYPELVEVGVRRRRSASNGEAPRTLGQVLLTPTRIYAKAVVELLRSYTRKQVITGMAHITGSGLAGNLCRALPASLDALVDPTSWPVPPIFAFLQEHGRIPDDEMRRVFNMGIGYCLLVKPAFADGVMEKLTRLGERVYRIGKVVPGKGDVRLG